MILIPGHPNITAAGRADRFPDIGAPATGYRRGDRGPRAAVVMAHKAVPVLRIEHVPARPAEPDVRAAQRPDIERLLRGAGRAAAGRARPDDSGAAIHAGDITGVILAGGHVALKGGPQRPARDAAQPHRRAEHRAQIRAAVPAAAAAGP